MFYKTVCAAIALAAVSTSVSAQGFSGGELTIDAFNYDDFDDDSPVNYSGALEYAINRNISVAVDAAVYDFSVFDDDVTTFTLHGVYHLNSQSSVGVLIGTDDTDDGNQTFYGLEGGYEANQFSVEGYFALYDDSDNSSVVGIDGAYQFTDQISAIGSLGFGEVSDEDITRIAAGAEYQFQTGPSIYAEVGNLDLDDGDDSNFVGIGAKIEFGAARGTTFDRRGAFATLIPGL